MSDEPARLAVGMTPVPRERANVLGHTCEHQGCTKHAGFGFARPRHRGDGEQYV
ncbi:hypothetical protein ACVDG5_036455 [Mesorhizobium sp. ORM6]